MKRPYWILCLLVVTTLHAQVEPPNTTAKPLTLAEAWRLGEQNSSRLKAAHAAVVAAEGRAADSRGLLWNNPELNTERVRRKATAADLSSSTSREWTTGLSQTVEIAGQHGYRREAAREELAMAQFLAHEAQREVHAEIELRFVKVLALQARIGIERDSMALIESTAAFAGKRVAAGEDSKLDGNMALIEAGRARNQLGALADQLLQARAELAELLQWSPTSLPEVVGELEARTAVPKLEALLAFAAERQFLKALQAREAAARTRLDLERAARFPDVTLGVGVGREGPDDFRDKVTLFTVSVPLPLFKRNAGNIAQAQADLANARAERLASERDVPANVRNQWQRLENLAARVKTLRAVVLPTLEENQRLSQKALREGEIGFAQQILINRQVLEGRRDLVEAAAELRSTRIALELAAGSSGLTVR